MTASGRSGAALERLEREAAARWQRHPAVLGERRERALHGPESGWHARDELAHLARWMGRAAERLEAAAAGRAREERDRDPNARWQAEDRALSLDAALARAERAREALLERARALPRDERGEGLLAIAAGDLVHHLDEHFEFLVHGVLAAEAAGWAALSAQLDARPSGVLHEGAGIVWEARDVYAHLGHWFAFAVDTFEAFAAGRPVPLVPDVDEANARWHGEDHARTLDDVLGAARTTRQRMLALARGVEASTWTALLLERLDANSAAHYEEHLGFMRAAS